MSTIRREDLVKVWPLKSDVIGCSVERRRITLQPGVAGFMLRSGVEAAVARGDVQVMAGLSVDALKKPQYPTAAMDATGAPAARKRRTKSQYSRSDMTADSTAAMTADSPAD